MDLNALVRSVPVSARKKWDESVAQFCRKSNDAVSDPRSNPTVYSSILLAGALVSDPKLW